MSHWTNFDVKWTFLNVNSPWILLGQFWNLLYSEDPLQRKQYEAFVYKNMQLQKLISWYNLFKCTFNSQLKNYIEHYVYITVLLHQ